MPLLVPLTWLFQTFTISGWYVAGGARLILGIKYDLILLADPLGPAAPRKVILITVDGSHVCCGCGGVRAL